MMPRRRSSVSMAYRSSCARSSPARPLLGLLVRSLSTRRCAASTRSRARSRSTRVSWRGSGRVRFLRGDGRAPNARWISPRSTPVNFFVTTPSLRTPGLRSNAAEFVRPASGGRALRHTTSRHALGRARAPMRAGQAKVRTAFTSSRQCPQRDGWDAVLKPVVARYRDKVSRIYFRANAGPIPRSTSFSKRSGSTMRSACLRTGSYRIGWARQARDLGLGSI
jgi:hypothetical protein